MKHYLCRLVALLLVLGSLVLAGCASTQQPTRDRSYQPSDDGRPAWFRISPPGI